jgi:hypothetical protein
VVAALSQTGLYEDASRLVRIDQSNEQALHSEVPRCVRLSFTCSFSSGIQISQVTVPPTQD